MVASSKKEIDTLKEAGKRLAFILSEIGKLAVPYVSSIDLEESALKMIFENNGTPSFKGYKIKSVSHPFPACLCVSINNEVVHGIPLKNKVIKNGDIVSLDLGMRWPAEDGFYVDAALTIPAGDIDETGKKLIDAGLKTLDIGISKMKAGARLGDVGEAVLKFVKSQGFNVAENLVGHGVGRAVHEDPMVPNWGKKNSGPKLKEGMVLAFEPMITEGSGRVVLDPNLWTWKTQDKSRAVHFEHTILITKNGSEILTKN